MSLFRTEKDFINAFKKKIGSRMQVIKIESHSTGNGIPDTFVQGLCQDFWIEFKNSKFTKGTDVHVPWRPGQQAWATEYKRTHINKCTLTLMSGKERIYFIPMYKVYKDDIVENALYMSIDEWNYLKSYQLFKILYMLTNEPRLTFTPTSTYRELIVDFISKYYPTDMDYDIDVIFPTQIVHPDDKVTSIDTWYHVVFEVMKALVPFEQIYAQQQGFTQILDSTC